MRKLVFAWMAAVLALGCTKEKIATEPCRFDITVDLVTGSKIQATITPEDENACYLFSFLSSDQPQYDWNDAELTDFQLGWMEDMYQNVQESGGVSSFLDMFGYKGPRTIRSLQFHDDMDYRLTVIQINPETREAVGPVHRVDSHTKPIKKTDITFRIQYGGDLLRIIPSNDSDTWFWEYEKESLIIGTYSTPYFFFYSVIDMYEQYGFLENQICKGPEEWKLTRDDHSFKPDTVYTLCLSGCEDGEITSEVYYLDFIYQNGQISFLAVPESVLLEPLN